jgi:hypothetical protein
MDIPVVTCCYHIWSISSVVVVDVIYTFFVRFQTEIGYWITKRPDFDCMIQTCRGEGLRIFGVDGESHDIMCMSFKDLTLVEMYRVKQGDTPGHISMLCPSPSI